ncbi:MAG: fumarylacetoacetate hydrolase family protein [Promethearchaeia archaeon]
MKIGKQKIKPTKIICLGRNYLDHIKETSAQVPEEPILFPKMPNCLVGNNRPIIYPKMLYENPELNRVDHEIELAFIMEKRGKHIPKSQAYEYIQGYTVFLDITARKLQRKDISSKKPWFRSKSFDTFGPIGPKIVPTEMIPDPHQLDLELKVNGEIKQKSNTKHLLFKIPKLVEYISSFFTLMPGDIIATGTPSGISPLKPGDKIQATIEKIGRLINPVVLEEN